MTSHIRQGCGAWLLWLVAAQVLSAQPAMPDAGLNAALSRLFGDHQAFTAKADVQVFEGAAQPNLSMTMGFALLDGKIRTEMNMAEIKSAKMPQGAAEGMKQMGMDRIVSIVRPDQKTLFILYPGLKAYVPMPLPKEQIDSEANKHKLESTPVGKETIGKHPTIKHKVVFTTESGEKQEAFTWNATDLKNFPIRIEMIDKQTRSLINYQDVKLVRPDADLFEPPKDYTRHENIQQMMQAAMKKMMEGKK